MFQSASNGPQESVIYFDGTPTTTKYAAGSRSWRTNNPGLVGQGLIAAQSGSIGSALGVAAFRDPETGRRALMAVLGSEECASLTVADALRRLIPGYKTPAREIDPVTSAPLSWLEPETGIDLELTMSAVGGQHQQLASLIERRIGFVPGLITQEALDTGTLNSAKRAAGGSPGNLLINGRSSAHAGSGGTLSTLDVCNTPSGNGCKTVLYSNLAKSSDAAKTASTVTVNGNPACTKDSIFAVSSGDESGRCGGVSSGTIKAKAEFITASNDVKMEGTAAARQFDLMVSNNRNTPPAPLMQSGGANPPFLDTVGAEEKEAAPPPWRFDWRIAGAKVKQLAGRWVVISGPGMGERRILDQVAASKRLKSAKGYWETSLVVPQDGDYEYALRLPDVRPEDKSLPHYDIPFHHYIGINGTASKSRSAHAAPRGEEIAVPVVVGLYADPGRSSEQIVLPDLGPGELTDKARFNSPHNQGWLYVYVDGFLWRELEVRGPTEEKTSRRSQPCYADVNLTQQMGRDLRPATVQTVRHLLLPYKVAGKKVKVEIAYSRVQWSWSRIVGYGGLHPQDPRWEKNAPVCLPQKQWPEAEKRRAKRMQQVDLSGYASGWPAQPGSRTKAGLHTVDELHAQQGDTLMAEYLDGHQGQGLPALLLDDPLGWARDKAYAYQQAWRDMEAYLADLSNPNHTGEKKKQFPFAPWFDSAVLANRYFFAPAPDLNTPNITKAQRKELVRAMDERRNWKNQLELGDIQQALGTKHRVVLREKIKRTKQQLVAMLDSDAPELESLVATLDDWLELPATPKGSLMIPDPDKTPRYGDGFAVMDELLARLGDDEYNLDLHLETEPPSTKEQYALQQSDTGRVFLKKLAKADAGHPLHVRLFPKQKGESRYAYDEVIPAIPIDFDVLKLQKSLAISRRTIKFVREFVNHFNSLAEKGAKEMDALVRLIGAGLLQMPLEDLEVTLEELVKGDLKKAGYVLAGRVVIEWKEPISEKLAEQYAKFADKKSPAGNNPIAIYQLDGKARIGTTSVENLRHGSAASSNHWARDINPLDDLSRVRVRVPVFKLSLVQKLKGSPAFNTGVLGGIAILEIWNLATAFNAVVEKWGREGQGLARFKVGEALSGMASTAGMLRDEYVKRVVAERTALMEASPKLKASSEKIARRVKPILNQSARWANGLGVIANAYSTVMSFWQMSVNIFEGDDAAISHAVMTVGFALATYVAAAKTVLAISALGETALAGWAGGVAVGPLGWVGLFLILAGTALLIWVFKENTPLDWWLKHGPFSKKSQRPHLTRGPAHHPQLGQEHERYVAEDGSQLLLREEQRILRIGGVNHCFSQGADGTILQKQEDGSLKTIGHIGEPLDLSRLDNPDERIAERFDGHTPGTVPDDQYGWWYVYPKSAAKALADAIFTPKITIAHRRATKADQPDILEIRIDLASFLDGKSLLFAELWRTDRDGKLRDKPGEDKVMLCTGEGSGPKTVRVEWPVVWSDVNLGIEHVCARVCLDLHGDGEFWLPMPPEETGAALQKDESDRNAQECVVRNWVEERSVLQMHAAKREAISNAKRQAYNARIEAMIRQDR